ncbi:DUF4352 domain-containing protein [Streptomyces xanthophaeus]|uniref:DUF4352 domain-containing protein n=1 Tax=Streptomyces xanthophaeus TaxID=67385 RepID=UPI003428B7DC
MAAAWGGRRGGALVGSDDGDDDSKAKPPAASSAPSQAPEKTAEAKASSAAPEKNASVEVTAKKTAFKASVLAQGDNYTSVSVTVTNNSSKEISVNPLFFTITDTAGTKHTPELGADEGQIGTVELAPGENITGTVTPKGKSTPRTVSCTDGLIEKAVRVDVSRPLHTAAPPTSGCTEVGRSHAHLSGASVGSPHDC